MGSFFADVAGIKQNFTGQLLLESKAPGLFVRRIQAATLYGSHGSETYIVESPQTVSWRGRDAASERSTELARGITESIPRRGVIDI